MVSLENLRKLRDEALGGVERILRKESNKLNSQSQRIKTKLELEHEKKLKELEHQRELSLNLVRNEAEKQKDSANNAYYLPASQIILERLNQDSALIDYTDRISSFSPEELSKAEQTIQALAIVDKINEGEERNTVRSVLESTLTPNLKGAMQVLATKKPEKTTIDLYLSADMDGVYLLVPTKNPQPRGIEKVLNDLVTRVISLGTAPNGHSKRCISPGIVVGPDTEIRFEQDIEDLKGFPLYSLKPEKDKDVQLLLRVMKKKLEELEPREIKDSGLSISFVDLEPGIIDYLRNPENDSKIEVNIRRGISEKKKDYVTAAEMIGYTTKGVKTLVTRGILRGDLEGVDSDSLEEFQRRKEESNRPSGKLRRLYSDPASFNPSEVRERTYSYLNECGEQINLSDIREICLMTTQTSAKNLVKRITGRNIGNQGTINKSVIERYLEGREPTRFGWKKRK